MKLERLFHVLVVTGASSTAGLLGCSSDDGKTASNGIGGETGTGGSDSGGSGNGGSSSGGTQSAGGKGGGGTQGGTGGASAGGTTASGGTSSGGTSSGGASSGGTTATGGTSSGGASSGGTTGDGGAQSTGGATASCDSVCMPNPNPTGTLCNGCCCWLPIGSSGLGPPICGDEPCCIGRGRN